MSVGRKLGSEETRIGSISFAVMSAPLKLTSCCRTPWNPIVLQIRKLPLVFSGKWELERKPVAATGRTRFGNHFLFPRPLPILT
ncbi:MAG: hypothetical protein CM1200mP2_39490 [Planctomycetaceae bacterium]|nr:MAG: hypothetical protein CM1200mP2_39490 [Planctomycetaceae bacterium]